MRRFRAPWTQPSEPESRMIHTSFSFSQNNQTVSKRPPPDSEVEALTQRRPIGATNTYSLSAPAAPNHKPFTVLPTIVTSPLPGVTSALLETLRRKFPPVSLRIAADNVPGRPRTHKDMHLNLNAGITIYATERHTMYLAVVCSTQCGSTNATEA
jgi:hypothetical protein